MKHIVILFTFLYISLQAATPVESNTTQQNSETNLTKIYIPTHYKDYTWDVGIIGGLTFDGTQIDYTRYTLGTGVHAAYHLNDAVSFHGEYVKYFKTIASSKYDAASKKIVENATPTNIMALSVAYDFSAERSYSLFAKAGLGYEFKDDQDAQEPKAPVSLLGFGFRYMFTRHISGYAEGRWKMRLKDMDEPDNSLIGTVGIDYHFGLDNDKAKLIDEADKHNAWVDEQLAVIAKKQERKAQSKENSNSK